MTKPDSAAPSTRIPVWDLPTRVLHGLLGASFLGAFAFATLADEHAPSFAVHMLLGAVAAGAVALRIAWGFVGTRYARFGSFLFGPRAVVRYLRGALAGDAERSAGHNPANAWAAYAMLALTVGLAATGALMSRGGHAIKEVHEALAYTMIAVVGAHLAGIALHTVRRRENIALGMLDGKKPGRPADAIAAQRPLVALLFVAAIGAWAVGLWRGYDPVARRVTLPLSGVALQLGEGEGGERAGRERHHERRRHERAD